MRNNFILVLFGLVLLTVCMGAAQIPKVQGNWTGSWVGYENGINYSESHDNESISFNIAEQKGRIFAGNLAINKGNGTGFTEGFAGAIGQDNKTIYITELLKGYAFGTIVSSDEIEIIYLSDGNGASVAIDTLRRVKE